MRTFTSIQGLSVFDLETGQELGVVEDLTFDSDRTIQGVIMDCKGLFIRDKFIPISDISSFGKDGVMVKEHKEFRSKSKEDQPLHHSNNGIFGKALFTSEGEKLGIVEDVYFNEKLGTIEGYEVTDGFFADMTEGRKVIQTHSPIVISKNSVVVDLNED